MLCQVRSRKGFTYTEVLLTLPIVLLSMFAAMAALLGSQGFNDQARVYSNAINLASYRLESIRKMGMVSADEFNAQMTALNGTRFVDSTASAAEQSQQIQTLWGLGLEPTTAEAIHYVEIDPLKPNLATVTVLVCYKERDRTYGEDLDFDGHLDPGEDKNLNGKIDCPVKLISHVARK